jgi:putative Mg2+ transporter-C (MgtC) family protein
MLRLLLAAGLGGAIGFERAFRYRQAGLRTHLLVCVGSALFTLVSAYGWSDFRFSNAGGVIFDPTRIAAQIVTGIGFLGAGAIIRHGASVRGLTTAATLWVVAAIGIAVGSGSDAAAVITTGVTLFALWPLRVFTHGLVARGHPEERRLHVRLRAGASAGPILVGLERSGVWVGSFEITEADGVRDVAADVDGSRAARERAIVELGALDQILAVRWEGDWEEAGAGTKESSPLQPSWRGTAPSG